MSALAVILFLILFILTVGGLLLGVSSLLRAKKVRDDAVKFEPYECGMEVQETPGTISVKFYLTAILFILFDIEIIFLFPWALVYKEGLAQGHGIYLLSVMGFFILLFILGLIWEIKSKALDWS